MEPHATVAVWEHGGLTLYDSTQGASGVASTIAKLFELEPAQVRVISPHVGGGFGSKGLPRPNVVLAAIAAKVVGRAGQGRHHAPADVRLHGLPHADDPAAAARRRRRTARLQAISHEASSRPRG